MTKKTASEIVVALLRECEVDGETMQDIIQKVGMEGQMLTQLVMNAEVEDIKNAIENREKDCPIYQQVFNAVFERTPKIDADALAEKIVDDIIDNLGTDEVEDYDLSMTGREVELTSITFDNSLIGRKIKEAIEEYIEDMEEVNA